MSLAVVVPACGDAPKRAADKAGGSTGPTVLRLASSDSAGQPESQHVRYFASQVEKLSAGKLKIAVSFAAAGSAAPDADARTAALVRNGDFDLGWIGARAWDNLGVTSFRALQLPFLITSYPLLQRVVKSPLATQMLAGLKSQGLVGLALVPGLLRHPAGISRPLVTLPDFAGARVRDQPSGASDTLLRALGSTPVHIGNAAYAREVAAGRLDGTEVSLLNAPIGSIVAANVTFFPKVLTLFAARPVFERLDTGQRQIMRAAAARTVHHAADFPVDAALGFEGVLARQFCRTSGRIGLATGPELAALLSAAAPAAAALEADQQTRAFAARIRAMKSLLPPPRAVVVPSSCSGHRSTVTSPPRSPSVLDGTYHELLTAARGQAFGLATSALKGLPLVVTTVLRDGQWTSNSDSPATVGSYRVTAAEVDFDYGGDVMRFKYAQDPDGTLHLRAIPPMDRGDQWIMSGAPWRRVGPPTRALP